MKFGIFKKSMFFITAVITAALSFTAGVSVSAFETGTEYNIVYYSGQESFSLWITEDGTLYSAGEGSVGQLGTGKTRNFFNPKKILENIDFASTGRDGFAFAVTKDGSLYSWGSNKYGELGNGADYNVDTSTNFVSVPTIIGFDGRIKDIKCGKSFALILTNNGDVFAAGSNRYGQLGNPSLGNDKDSIQNVFKKIDGNLFDNKKITAISACENTSFALTEDGEIYSFGDNYYGELGIGESERNVYKTSPVKIESLPKIKKISSFVTTFMALDYNNNVFVWGNNNSRQLGIFELSDSESESKISFSISPVELSLFYNKNGEEVKNTKITDIQCGGLTNFILDENGKVYSFGQGGTGDAGFNVQSNAVLNKYKNKIQSNNVLVPLEITFYEPIDIYSLYNGSDVTEAQKEQSPVDASKQIEVKTTEFLGSCGARTFLKDENGKIWSYGNNTSTQACSGDANTVYLPVRSTLYRVQNYDVDYVEKDYLTKPIITLCVLLALLAVFIIKTEIKNKKTEKD